MLGFGDQSTWLGTIYLLQIMFGSGNYRTIVSFSICILYLRYIQFTIRIGAVICLVLLFTVASSDTILGDMRLQLDNRSV